MYPTLMILFIFLTLGFAVTSMTLSEIKIANNHLKATQAFYLAEAGIAEAVNILYSNPNAKGTIVDKMPIGNGEVTVKGTWSGNVITLEAVGKVGGTKRTVKQKLKVEVGNSAIENALSTFKDTNETSCIFANDVEIDGNVVIGLLSEIYQNVIVNGNFYTIEEPLVNESLLEVKVDNQLNLLSFPPIPNWDKPKDLDQAYEYANVNDVNAFKTGYKYYLAKNVDLLDDLELNNVYIECSTLTLRGRKYSGVTFVVDGPILITANNASFENINLIANDSITIEGNHLEFKKGILRTGGEFDAARMRNANFYDVHIYSNGNLKLSNNISFKPGLIMTAENISLENYFKLEGYVFAKGMLTAKNNVEITGSVGAGGVILDNNVRINHSQKIDVLLPSTIPTGVKVTRLRWSEGPKTI